MAERNIVIGIVVVLALAAVAFLFYRAGTALAPSATGSPALKEYRSDEYGVGFSYPEGYYLKEADAGMPERPQLAVVLVEDTEENRDVVEGRSTIAREGPPAITVEAYPNPKGLSPADWIRESTNWTIRTTELEEGRVAGREAASFGWSGLYEGSSAVVANGEHAYVFSVTWMDANDRIRSDYASILSSVELF